MAGPRRATASDRGLMMVNVYLGENIVSCTRRKKLLNKAIQGWIVKCMTRFMRRKQ